MPAGARGGRKHGAVEDGGPSGAQLVGSPYLVWLHTASTGLRSGA